MGKTVKQISQELNISKPAITQRMNAIKNFRLNYTRKVGNHLEISKRGVELLTNYNTTFSKQFDKQSSSRDSKQINATYLMSQIEIKDKQINNLQKSLDKQQTLLDQQQQLQLTTFTENRNLKEKIQKLNSLIETSKTVSKQQVIGKNTNLSNMYKFNGNKNVKGKQATSGTGYSKKQIRKKWWKFW